MYRYIARAFYRHTLAYLAKVLSRGMAARRNIPGALAIKVVILLAEIYVTFSIVPDP